MLPNSELLTAAHQPPLGGKRLPDMSSLHFVSTGGVEPITELAGDGDQLALPQEATKFIKKKQPSKKVKKGRRSPLLAPPTSPPSSSTSSSFMDEARLIDVTETLEILRCATTFEV